MANPLILPPRKLPIFDDGVHTTAEGLKILGTVTASAVNDFYKAIK